MIQRLSRLRDYLSYPMQMNTIEYTSDVEIKDFNALIEGKSFLDTPIKNKEKAYKKMIQMRRNNDCTTVNLLDCEYLSKNYKLISTDLSKQIELQNSDLKQQINSIGRLDRDNEAAMFFII